jgi:hypothetical protein
MQGSLWSIVPIFRAPFLERVARGTHVSPLRELAKHYSEFSQPSPSDTLAVWFDFFYRLLFEKYRCEYVYKNAIATKLFLSRHSLQNSFMTDELRSASSRADVAILNGTSTIYEIKTKYDSFDRLEAQLLDYRRIFDCINIVTTETKANTAIRSIDSTVGIIILRENGILSTLREPISNRHNTDPGSIFDCMRRAEFCSAVIEAFGFVPQVPNSRLYREARQMFCSLPPAEAHDLMVRQVKRRGKKKPFVDLVSRAPISLKHACLTFTKSAAMAKDIMMRLETSLT